MRIQSRSVRRPSSETGGSGAAARVGMAGSPAEETALAAGPGEGAAAGRAPQAARDGRSGRRGWRDRLGTSGALEGTDGLRLGLLLGGLSIFALTTVNALSQLHERPGLHGWEPFVWEYTSGLASVALLALPWWINGRLRRGPGGWPAAVLWHALGSVAFSVLHVALFVALRHGAYAMAGEAYVFERTVPEFLYEYRKDVLGYVVAALAFWFAPRLLASKPEPAPAPASAAPGEGRLLAIQDGARLIRAPAGAVLAVRSAGNYVEYLLADGRRPLVRRTLAAVEAELAAEGFVRTHRSWLVNAARVREVEPAGSGDRRLRLEGGVEAPLSRRYTAALAALSDV